MMAAKELSLQIYLLDEKSKKPVDDWVSSAAGQAGEGLRAEVLECSPADAARTAPFSGLPFLLAGSRTSLEDCFAAADDAARRVFGDCAYFWTLSDKRSAASAFAAIDRKQGRTLALSWQEEYYNYLLSPLRLLNQYEGLAGLSMATHRTRNEIARIARGYQGAFSPVLILGDPGSGKEVVSTSLWKAYRSWLKSEQGQAESKPTGRQALGETSSTPEPVFNLGKDEERHSIACGWFGDTLLLDQLFGHEKGAFTGADQRSEGLLEKAANGCVFLDDFDVAPPATLAALLRVMSTDWGNAASFHRLGGTQGVPTNAWLVFATNADIPAKVASEKMRPDFIYRFEDRVIHLRPLAARPADIPQIALRLWETIWRGHKDPIGLGPSNIGLLLAPGIAWPGNIRQLRALLSLVASRQRLTRQPLRTLITEILALGDYNRWVGIVIDPEVSHSPARADAPSCLSVAGVRAFNSIVEGMGSSAKANTPSPLRLTQILNRVFEKRSIVAGEASVVNRSSPVTAELDLKALASDRGDGALLKCLDGKTYTPVEHMFRPTRADPSTVPSDEPAAPRDEPEDFTRASSGH
jgi:transcriptional regulator with AAA-type ATPase domain